MGLTSKDILDSDDLAKEKVLTPEWGPATTPVSERFVFVRALSGGERDQFEASMSPQGDDGERNLANLRARLCALSLCDDGGAPLFTFAEVEQLGKKSAAVLDRLFDVARRLSGISTKDEEVLLKNSGGEPAAASGSGSPVTLA